jgi:hypothetical protein
MKTLYEKIVESEDLDKVFTPFNDEELRKRNIEDAVRFLAGLKPDRHEMKFKSEDWVRHLISIGMADKNGWGILHQEDVDYVVNQLYKLDKIEK